MAKRVALCRESAMNWPERSGSPPPSLVNVPPGASRGVHRSGERGIRMDVHLLT